MTNGILHENAIWSSGKQKVKVQKLSEIFNLQNPYK